MTAIYRKPKGERWTREETIIAFALYCRIPFNKSSKNHPEVQRIADLIGRSSDTVNLKVGNFGSLDPALKARNIVGLAHASNLDKQIWREFHGDWESLAQEAERAASAYRALRREVAQSGAPPATAFDPAKIRARIGEDKLRISKARLNQNFFRRTILAAYGGACCITGINIAALLNASHIKPWAKCDQAEKLNPANGLCLNALHDRAFDRGLITIDRNYAVKLSRAIADAELPAVAAFFSKYAKGKIHLPEKFIPDTNFLAWHERHIFIR